MRYTFCWLFIFVFFIGCKNYETKELEDLWHNPSEESKSWTYWYWMYGALSEEGIKADLEAMKNIGLAGAYLMPIRGVPEEPLIEPSYNQLTPEWWKLVKFAFEEADRVGLKIAFHVCDGFALAGGPWITPELSMQRITWNTTQIKGGSLINLKLDQPLTFENYYKDIALFAYPTPEGEGVTSLQIKPKVTSSIQGVVPQFLSDETLEGTFRSEDSCWIQYAFEEPFTLRSIQVERSGNNFQSQRLIIHSSDDGVNFNEIARLVPPRQGWQEVDFYKLGREFPITHAIPETTACYFRFYYDKSGTEPGSEDIDAAKWKQSLKIKKIILSSSTRIHQHEGKSGLAWRLAPRTTEQQIDHSRCIQKKELINLSDKLDENGNLVWDAPKGNWMLLRIGHTSNGYDNGTGGGGRGLECDKFNPEAIKLQFDSWFGKAVEILGDDLAKRVLQGFHVDSWECGCQNWSPVFRKEFLNRRGYDIVDYLPVMTGIPLESVEKSEEILLDVRKTISELVVDNFYGILKKEANSLGCDFSAECVAPTMMSDGMMHYRNTDIPMGEYWLQSPTHDKPNDILDAISGAHIYGKNIVQAEAFTQLKMMFNEHPQMVKALQDRHYALGINRLSYHVYALNPWLNKKPGMTLDGIGLYFQRDQTWWNLGKAWVEYAQRCQSLLQVGKPVVDLAVYTGEDFPRRAILPDRLVPFLPGIFGEEKVKEEQDRLANIGEPTHQMPVGVTHSKNITNSEDWINALRGYAYDSFNTDALLNSAEVINNRIVLKNGMSYSALVIPGKHSMSPNSEFMSKEVVDKLIDLRNKGAIILMDDKPSCYTGKDVKARDIDWRKLKEDFIKLPFKEETFTSIGIDRDFEVIDKTGSYANNIAYAHREDKNIDIYFVANQEEKSRELELSFRVKDKVPEIWNPVNGDISEVKNWKIENGRIILEYKLEPIESLFFVFRKDSKQGKYSNTNIADYLSVQNIDSPWLVSFDPQSRGPKEPIKFNDLIDWTLYDDNRVKFYSGTAKYENSFDWTYPLDENNRFYIEFEDVSNLAEVKINGISCGTIWTYPYRVEITNALKIGENRLEIEVVNTWINRILGDEEFKVEKDESEKIWTNARFRHPDKKLAKSGIIGKVKISQLN